MKKTGLPTVLLLVATLLQNPLNAEQNPPYLMLFAASSLSDVMADLSASFTKRSGIVVRSNLGSSGTLARQMEQGAPVDVFVSASEEWMDHVQKMGLVDTKTITRIASNALVFIAPRQSSLTIKGVDSSLALLPLLGSGRLSMGEPAHVPAGSYGREALLYFGWYEQLKPRILAAKDVRSALMVVELGEAPLGIVFKTDALKSQKVRIVATIPPRSHKPIVYLAASAPGSMVGKRFIGFINQAPTDSLWLNHGFTLKN